MSESADQSELQAEVRLGISSGLHLRPITRLVKALNALDCEVHVQFNDQTADARSVHDLMLLGAPCGSVLRLRATGNDGAAAMQTTREILEQPE